MKKAKNTEKKQPKVTVKMHQRKDGTTRVEMKSTGDVDLRNVVPQLFEEKPKRKGK